jgi:hypothetical protein
MPNDIASAVITIAAVFLGWLLGEGTSLVREFRKRRRIIAALLEDLSDCEGFIRRNLITSEHLIQIIAVKAFAGFAPVPIPQTVFERYYPEVVVRLRRGERISFSAIHSHIREMNKMADDIATQMAARETSQGAVAALAELVAAFRINAQITAHMIVFHRKAGRRVNPWTETTAEAKALEAKFIAEVHALRSQAIKLGHAGVTKKVLAAE